MTGFVLVFASTHTAMTAQKLLSGLPGVAMMPTPRKISASCGLSLLVPQERLEPALDLLRSQAQLEGLWEAYHLVEGASPKKIHG